MCWLHFSFCNIECLLISFFRVLNHIWLELLNVVECNGYQRTNETKKKKEYNHCLQLVRYRNMVYSICINNIVSLKIIQLKWFISCNCTLHLPCFDLFWFALLCFVCCFINLFSQLASLVWRIQNLIIEDWEVKCKTQADWMCWLHFTLANVKCILVSGLGIVNNG